ncbi:MAG: hypothetical protein E7022_08405 [Desulfovibrio desulfuricans]|nr:hypothetical protein [Desulfovibrio desulfuricans]
MPCSCAIRTRRRATRWLRMGGSPYGGPVDNAGYGGRGAFYLLRGLFDTISRSEAALKKLEERLAVESAARNRLETLLRRLQPGA